jgi:hypothetical protein
VDELPGLKDVLDQIQFLHYFVWLLLRLLRRPRLLRDGIGNDVENSPRNATDNQKVLAEEVVVD